MVPIQSLARGLGKHYHIHFDLKLGHGICAIHHIPCTCVACTSMLDQPLISGIQSTKQVHYQPFINCTYWPVMGPYNNWNIIHPTQKSITSETFDEIHQVVLDGISENMSSLVQLGMYGAINTDDTTTNGLYVIQFISDAYTLQSNTTIYGQVISDGELVFKTQYIFSMHENTNYYRKQQPLQQTIIVPTRTVIHARLEVIIIIYVQDTPKKLTASTKQKKQYKDIQLL